MINNLQNQQQQQTLHAHTHDHKVIHVVYSFSQTISASHCAIHYDSNQHALIPVSNQIHHRHLHHQTPAISLPFSSSWCCSLFSSSSSPSFSCSSSLSSSWSICLCLFCVSSSLAPHTPPTHRHPRRLISVSCLSAYSYSFCCPSISETMSSFSVNWRSISRISRLTLSVSPPRNIHAPSAKVPPFPSSASLSTAIRKISTLHPYRLEYPFSVQVSRTLFLFVYSPSICCPFWMWNCSISISK
mmetsp:Transcript_72150/g.115013  ORF Transcript_72150/g.115013 Transcript_72150/m.115013 type:complete len:243 (+) Transcript_72150:114-842(+)